jgi:HD-like signal output (HDOD) protein
MKKYTPEEKHAFMQKVTDLIELLPPLPNTISKLIDENENPQKRVLKLHEAIGHDSGLCADLLRLANCPCRHGKDQGSHNVKTIDEAIKLVGIEPLADFIAARFAIEAVKTKCHALKHINEYSEHSKEISLGCIILSEVLGLSEEEQKMMGVGGLIHDIGRLIILIASDSTNAPLVGTSPEKFQEILKEEFSVWGIDHSKAGARICQRWHMPEELEEGVLRHHTPLLDDDFSFHGSLIFTAHFIVMSDFTGDIINRLLPKRLFEKMGMTIDHVNEAMDLYKTRKEI